MTWWNKNKGWNNNHNNCSWQNKTNYVGSNLGGMTNTITPKPVYQTKEVSIPVELHESYKDLENLLCNEQYKELIFTPYAWAKINCYIHLVGDKEITGFGKIEDGFITDVKIISQEIRGAYCASKDDMSIAEFMTEVPFEEIEQGLWNLDWHSHVDMETFASGTDWGNYNRMLELRKGKAYPAMVINKRGEFWCSNILGNHKCTSIRVVIPVEKVTQKELKAIYDECSQDILTKCTAFKTVYTSDNKVSAVGGFAYHPVGEELEEECYAVNGTYDADYNETDEVYEKAYCASCGTELFSAEELKIGLCEDCANHG